MKPPLRLLTAVPICDGHDSAINTINLELVAAGAEVVYLGYHRPARDIVRAAIQEDVHAVGISSYNGGHVEFFSHVAELLKKRGSHIRVFGGGGGTILPPDAARMKKRGVDRIFFAGTPLTDIVTYVMTRYAPPPPTTAHDPDLLLARHLTLAEGAGPSPARNSPRNSPRHSPVIGVTGPGGAGKTTLIDELVLRLLTHNPKLRLAILSHDPSIIGRGALLGDRASMIYCQNDRVFMRSLATRGRPGGLSAATRRCLAVLQASARFDLIFVETVGIGQEALPFQRGLADLSILVMSPDYGARLQLQKIAMLDAADVIVVNKSDRPGASTARAEIASRLAHRQPRTLSTIASRHRNPGVDDLFHIVRATLP